MIPTSYGIIIMDKENTESLRESNPARAFLMHESEVKECQGNQSDRVLIPVVPN